MIEFDRIRFGYHRRDRVLDGFSWVPEPGVTVLLGPNGVGKSTLLSLAAGALDLDAGSIRVSGRAHDSPETSGSLGWMPQRVHAIPGLTVGDQVALSGWFKGLSTQQAGGRATAALGRVGLDDLHDRRTTRLSGGQLARVGLASAIVHDPTVVLLDEPTNGMDPTQRARFRLLLDDLAETVIVATHQVDDVTLIADRVALMGPNRIVYEAPVDDFLGQSDLSTSADVSRRAESAYSRLLPHEL